MPPKLLHTKMKQKKVILKTSSHYPKHNTNPMEKYITLYPGNSQDFFLTKVLVKSN